jgi:hypothetical protein
VELVSIHSQAREPTEACEVKQTNIILISALYSSARKNRGNLSEKC